MLQKQLPELNTKIRDTFGQNLLVALEEAVPGSIARLRGSLAAGNADQYSDIDLSWDLPDAQFLPVLSRLPGFLSNFHPVDSLRYAPEFQNSDKRRLVFIQFKDLPLFWRVDLEIFAQSIREDRSYDLDNPSAWGKDWSATHSALMNATAAVKALLRGQEKEAVGLIQRGFERAGLEVQTGHPQHLILTLADQVAVLDPSLKGLSDRIKYLHQQVLGQGG